MANVIYRRPDCRHRGSRGLKLVFGLKPSPTGDDCFAATRVHEALPSSAIDLPVCRPSGLARRSDVIDLYVLYAEPLPKRNAEDLVSAGKTAISVAEIRVASGAGK